MRREVEGHLGHANFEASESITNCFQVGPEDAGCVAPDDCYAERFEVAVRTLVLDVNFGPRLGIFEGADAPIRNDLALWMDEKILQDLEPGHIWQLAVPGQAIKWNDKPNAVELYSAGVLTIVPGLFGLRLRLHVTIGPENKVLRLRRIEGEELKRSVILK
jgi:hypothetical protein